MIDISEPFGLFPQEEEYHRNDVERLRRFMQKHPTAFLTSICKKFGVDYKSLTTQEKKYINGEISKLPKIDPEREVW